MNSEIEFKFERLSKLPPLDRLLAECEREGWRFLHRLADEWQSGANRFDRPGEAFFVAVRGMETVGVCGLNVDPYAGDVSFGRVRRLYVLPSCRGRGVGGGLLEGVVGAARSTFNRLRLRTENDAAGRLYERAGFIRMSGDPFATHELVLEPL